jgi:hypothetical protein
MHSAKPKLTTRPLSYFEHNDQRGESKVIHLDVVEWDMPEPEPTILVEESRNNFKVNAVKRAWEKLIGKRP